MFIKMDTAKIRALALSALLCLVITAQAIAASPGQKKSSSAGSSDKDSVVRIVTATDQGIGQGTGFYVHNNIIATNYHVIEGAKTIAYGRGKDPVIVNKIITFDEQTDLALLYTQISATPLTFAYENLTPGMKLTAIGYPAQKNSFFSSPGIFVGWENINDVRHLQFNGIIMPGMSGGPIVNSMNQVVAINRLGNPQEVYILRAGIAVSHLEQLLNQALNTDYSDYIDVEEFFKSTRRHLESEIKNGVIVITDN